MTVISEGVDRDRVFATVTAANDLGVPLLMLFLATRPCYVKLASVATALRSSRIPYLLIDSGQHYDPDLTEPRRELGYERDISVYLRTRGDLVKRLGVWDSDSPSFRCSSKQRG